MGTPLVQISHLRLFRAYGSLNAFDAAPTLGKENVSMQINQPLGISHLS